jgi:DNA-binding transcriptional regulator YdaS (Cro superfamily)
MSQHPIDVAAWLLGGQAALASALGVSRGAVPQWKQSDRRIPAEYCPKVERLTDGKVTCEQLRPDIEWGVLRLQVQPLDEDARKRDLGPAARTSKVES